MQNSTLISHPLQGAQAFGLKTVLSWLCVLVIGSILLTAALFQVKASLLLIVTLAIPMVLLIALDPMRSVLLLVVLLPFDFFLQHYFQIPGSFIQYLEPVVVTGAIMGLGFRGKLRGVYRNGLIVGAFGLAVMVSYVFSLRSHIIQVKTAEALTHCLLFFAMVALLRSPHQMESFWRVLMVPYAIIVGTSLYQMAVWDYGFLFRLQYPDSLFLDWTVPFDRVTGPFEHPNTNAGFLVGLFCLIGIPYAIRGGRANLRVFWEMLAVTAVVEGATGSNGAAAGLGAALAAYIVLFSKRKLRNLVWLCMGLVIAGVALWAHWQSRVETSAQGRLLVWVASWQEFLAHPWLGAGVGSFSEWYGNFIPQGTFGQVIMSGHSIYMNTLAEMGLVGTTFFMMLVCSSFREALRLARSTDIGSRCIPAAIICFLVYFSVHGLVDQLTFHANYAVLFWGVLAASSATWQPGAFSSG